MSGHLESIDGLLLYRQAEALAYGHSLHFSTPLWWGGVITTSKYGIGLSLLYVPGLLVWSWLQPYTPVQAGHSYDFALLYADPLYTAAAAPVHIAVAALSAYFVARLLDLLGYGRKIALWGMALFGLASPAIVYARGDWAQPLAGLCWVVAIDAAISCRRHTTRRDLLLCSLALSYAVLTRPVEGSLLFPAVLLLFDPDNTGSILTLWRSYGFVTLCFSAAIVITLLVNWGRYGSPFDTGYSGEGWTTPLWAGLEGSLLSPGWGLPWQFPAVLLVPVGFSRLWRSGKQRIALALGALIVAQLVNTATWHDWAGGWNWGLRLFVPALPLCAALAAIGTAALPRQARLCIWLPALLFLGGVAWAIPCIVTDLLGGYANMIASGPLFALRDYPPIGAWSFLHHWRAFTPLDSNGADILWLRVARSTGNASLVPPLLLVVASVMLGRLSLVRAQEPASESWSSVEPGS
jgi:hypothetical protein